MRKLFWRWVNRRIPRADEYRLGRRNIFVLPTREGLMFAGLLILCLLTGINYQNSLIYLFTFFLGTAFYATIFQTYRNLDDLHIAVISVGQGVAGEVIPLHLRLSAADGVARPSLVFSAPDQSEIRVSVDEGGSEHVTAPVLSMRRGYVTVPPVRIETDFPFGLIRAWTWIRPERQGVATPRPIMPPSGAQAEDENITESPNVPVHDGGQADLRLRPYRVGDPLRRVSWKRYARTGHMTVADWDSPPADPSWIDWEQYPGVDRELRLSYLAWQVEDAYSNDRPFGMKLPGHVFPPELTESHYRNCLEALGTFGDDGGRL